MTDSTPSASSTASQSNVPGAIPAAPTIPPVTSARDTGVSVIIITKNEEGNLPGCLASVAWCDDIHVLDSGSTDRTREIAEAAGAHFSIRPFDDFSSQQNFAMETLPFKHKWVFNLDADERATPELSAAIQRVPETAGDVVCFRVTRRDFFQGTWLKHVQATSTYQRVFIQGKMRYERLVHPIQIADGPVGELTGYLDHEPFSKGISQWVDRHNQYSSYEARMRHDDKGKPKQVSLIKALFDRDRGTRRIQQKEIYYKLPLRPIVKFLWMYVWKLGFLDGRAGLAYSLLIVFYEYLIILKERELARGGRS